MQWNRSISFSPLSQIRARNSNIKSVQAFEAEIQDSKIQWNRSISFSPLSQIRARNSNIKSVQAFEAEIQDSKIQWKCVKRGRR